MPHAVLSGDHVSASGRNWLKKRFWAGFGLSLVLASPLSAGTICGTVRDASSAAPIPRAGVFVRETTGAYTGLYAATDLNGQYCVGSVPPGTYDLEFRVDNYIVDYTRDVVVNDDATGIDAELVPTLTFRTWPNPASKNVVLAVSLHTPGAIQIEIFDSQGKRVRSWSGSAGERFTMTWNFRDANGRPVPSGVYYARARHDRGSMITRIIRIK